MTQCSLRNILNKYKKVVEEVVEKELNQLYTKSTLATMNVSNNK